MRVAGISFDCAGTLLASRWEPGAYIAELALTHQVPASQVDIEDFRSLVRSHLPTYLEANLARTDEALAGFWSDLTTIWLARFGLGRLVAAQMIGDGMAKLPTWFDPYPDVLSTLAAIQERGIPMIVLSNWDHSLRAVLQSHGMTEYFVDIFASLEEGVEKPDPRLFEIAMQAFSCQEKGQILHVGDDWTDDVEGSNAFGWQPLFLDRTGVPNRETRTINDLTQVLEWLD